MPFLDSAFTVKRFQYLCLVHGMRHRVVEKQPAEKGSVVWERHWIVG